MIVFMERCAPERTGSVRQMSVIAPSREIGEPSSFSRPRIRKSGLSCDEEKFPR